MAISRTLLLYRLSTRAHLERARSQFPAVSAMSAFGAGVALSSFYAARQVNDPPRAISCLAWAFALYILALVISFVWPFIRLPTSRPASEFFLHDLALILKNIAIITTLGGSIVCIASGTFLLAIALALSDVSRATGAAGYASTLAIVLLGLFALATPWIFALLVQRNRIYSAADVEREAMTLLAKHGDLMTFLRRYKRDQYFLRKLVACGQVKLGGTDGAGREEREEKNARLLYHTSLALHPQGTPLYHPGDGFERGGVNRAREFLRSVARWQQPLDILHSAGDVDAFFNLPEPEQLTRFLVLQRGCEVFRPSDPPRTQWPHPPWPIPRTPSPLQRWAGQAEDARDVPWVSGPKPVTLALMMAENMDNRRSRYQRERLGQHLEGSP